MRVNHVNIVVSDMERSLAFYVGLLGMRVTFEAELEGDWVARVSGLEGVSARVAFCQPPEGSVRFELVQYRHPVGTASPGDSLPNTPGLRHVALEVEDLTGWHARLAAAGVPFLSEPVTVPFAVAGPFRRRLCYLLDPDGTLIELMAQEFAAPAAASTPER